MNRTMIIAVTLICVMFLAYDKSYVYAAFGFPVIASSSVIDKTQYNKPSKNQRRGEQRKASIISVTPGSTVKVQKGDTVNFTCVANGKTTAVKLVSDNNPSDTVTATKYTLRGNNRVFNINWAPKNTGADSVKIYAGDGNSYTSDYQLVQINVVTANVANISDAYTNKSRIKSGSHVVVTVITNTAVSKVWLNVPREGNILHTTDYTTQDDKRVWKITWQPKSTGAKSCQVLASDNKGNRDSHDFNIDVL